jgi:hypothetical protein
MVHVRKTADSGRQVGKKEILNLIILLYSVRAKMRQFGCLAGLFEVGNCRAGMRRWLFCAVRFACRFFFGRWCILFLCYELPLCSVLFRRVRHVVMSYLTMLSCLG